MMPTMAEALHRPFRCQAQDGKENISWRLVKIDPASRKATIAIGSKSKSSPATRFFSKETRQISRLIARRRGRQGDARKAILAGQFANDKFRDRWLQKILVGCVIRLKCQISARLKLSEHDVVPIEWAFDRSVLTLETRPSQIQPKAVPMIASFESIALPSRNLPRRIGVSIAVRGASVERTLRHGAVPKKT